MEDEGKSQRLANKLSFQPGGHEGEAREGKIASEGHRKRSPEKKEKRARRCCFWANAKFKYNVRKHTTSSQAPS